MSSELGTCPGCGARVEPDDERCDLCGTPVEANEASAESDDDSSGDQEPAGEMDSRADQRSIEEGGVDHVYCYQCGWENPVEANYCSQCGQQLQDVDAGSEGPEVRSVDADLPQGSSSAEDVDGDAVPGREEGADVGKRVLGVVGVAVLLVVGFFFVTQWSQQRQWTDESPGEGSSSAMEQSSRSPTGDQQATGEGGRSATPRSSEGPADLRGLVDDLSGPIDGPVADRIDSVRTRMERAQGDEKRELQVELVQLYTGAGAPGWAALVQSRIADETETPEDRRRAADLLYRWMQQVGEQGGREGIEGVARHVATAYETVVRRRPDDLDARTRMGEAYLLTNEPMKGIQEINSVLEDDSTFVPARFQKGLALLQIGRLEEAIREFEQVKQYANREEPFYQQAERAIEVIREQTQEGAGEGDVQSRP